LRSAWRTAETTASAGGHGMRNDDKTHGPGARGAGAVHNWLRRHAGCNVLAEVSHIELSHVRTVVFSGRQRQRSFHDRRRALTAFCADLGTGDHWRWSDIWAFVSRLS
jgi:hypothetical protein